MILVTGGAGYIGSHCALYLLEKGVDILIFDNLKLGHKEVIDTLSNLDTKGNLKEFIKGDLTNFDDINNVFRNYLSCILQHYLKLKNP